MLVTWNGSNRPTPTRGEGTLGKIIPPCAAKRHEGLFSLLDIIKTIRVPKAIMRLNVSTISIGITSFLENSRKKSAPSSLMRSQSIVSVFYHIRTYIPICVLERIDACDFPFTIEYTESRKSGA